MKHVKVQFLMEDSGLCKSTFLTADTPKRYFNRSTETGIWSHTYPSGNYCENDCLVSENIVFEIVSKGQLCYLDGNEGFEGKRPFLPFCHFEKRLAEDFQGSHPGLKDYYAMKDKLLSLPRGEAYTVPHSMWENWVYALDFDNAVEKIVGEAAWLANQYDILAVRYTHKPTGFPFVNYRFRNKIHTSGFCSHDLLLYDWEESLEKG